MFYIVTDLGEKFCLCWPWDKQKEDGVTDIPFYLSSTSDSVCWKDKIFAMQVIFYVRGTRIYIHVYDLIEQDWVETFEIVSHVRHRLHRFWVFDGRLLLVNRETQSVCTQVFEFDETDGVWNKKEFPIPRGFESELCVEWL